MKLLQTGTGLRVSALNATQPPPPSPAAWRTAKVFTILAEHEWIEPAETVSDDLVINLAAAAPIPLLFEVRLVCPGSRRTGNIFTLARQFIPTDATVKERSA